MTLWTSQPAKSPASSAFAHRIRGKRYPTGCGLSALAKANLRDPRTKPAYPSSAPGLRCARHVA